MKPKIDGNFLYVFSKEGYELWLNVNHITSFYRDKKADVYILMQNTILYAVDCDISQLRRTLEAYNSPINA